MKQASYQSVWCLLQGVVTWQAEAVKRDLLYSKVKLICFFDTPMTLTPVNIRPALFFSLLEANPGVGTIHHADHTWGASVWLRALRQYYAGVVLEEKSWKCSSHVDVSFSNTNSSPLEIYHGLVLACNPKVSGELVCCWAVHWAPLLV